jgi:hypothetical protein
MGLLSLYSLDWYATQQAGTCYRFLIMAFARADWRSLMCMPSKQAQPSCLSAQELAAKPRCEKPKNEKGSMRT